MDRAESSASSEADAHGVDAPRLSWREKELLAALKRLAGAQSQVALLEERLAAQARATEPDVDDVARLDEVETELVKLRPKAHSRFGGASARDRIAELEMQERMVLDRLGFATAEEFRARVDRSSEPAEAVDPAFVEFAHRELAEAEAAYLQILTLPDDEPVSEPLPSEEMPDEVGPIDLTHPEAS